MTRRYHYAMSCKAAVRYAFQKGLAASTEYIGSTGIMELAAKPITGTDSKAKTELIQKAVETATAYYSDQILQSKASS